MKNQFIVFMGGEGSGKSTLLNHVKATLPGVVTSREPGGSPYAESIRSLIFSEGGQQASPETRFGLVFAARHNHVTKLIIPALETGPVISDRFDCCTYAYQVYGEKAHHLEDLFWRVRDVFVPRKPDLYIFFDVDPAAGLARAASRRSGGQNNYFDEESLPFHERIREGYREFIRHVPHVVIDANQPLDAVKADLERVIRERLG